MRLGAGPDVHRVVQATDGVRHPAGAQFDDAAPEIRELFQHAVQHQHGNEPLRGLEDHRQILGADHLGAAAGALALRAAVVHPLVGNGQRGTADMQDERRTGLFQPPPDGIVIGMAGGAAAGRSGRNPDGAELQRQRFVDQGDGALGIVQRHQCNADQSSVAVAELRHGAIVSGSRGVANVHIRGAEDLRGAERREHHLATEPQQIQRQAPLLAAEGAQGVVPLGAAGDAIAQRNEFGHRLRRMAARASVAAHALADVGETDVAQARNALPHGALDIARQEVRQFHQVAVGVENDRHRRGRAGSVAHDMGSLRAARPRHAPDRLRRRAG